MDGCDLEATATVSWAAAWLDEHWPAVELGTTWFDAVDVRTLDLTQVCRCVAGQLALTLARYEGYEVRVVGENLEKEPPYVLLGDSVIDVNGQPLSGYDAFINRPIELWQSARPPHDCPEPSTGESCLMCEAWAPSFEERVVDEFLVKLRKRLNFTELPPVVDDAFGGDISTGLWVDEIQRRRNP